MAYRESYGFFPHVSERDWKQRKANAKARVHDSKPNPRPSRGGGERNKAGTWHQLNWDPDFSCGAKDIVGGTQGHNSKWLCDPHRLQSRENDCLVYNFGVATQNDVPDFSFERGLHEVAPNCDIHVFDPQKDYTNELREAVGSTASFHQYGLKASYAQNETYTDSYSLRKAQWSSDVTAQLRTLQEIKKELGHEGRTIDVLALDCRGCEWKVYKDWLQEDIRQLNIELHDFPLSANETMFDLHLNGYVIIHKHWEFVKSSGNWVQYAFLKLAPSFFE